MNKLKWVLLWAVLIFILCCLPGRTIPYRNFWDLFGLDKLIHASLFCILILLAANIIFKQSIYNKNKLLIIAVLVAILYGGLLEFFQQHFVQGRAADILDFVANSTGAIIGACFHKSILMKIKFLIRKKKNKD